MHFRYFWEIGGERRTYAIAYAVGITKNQLGSLILQEILYSRVLYHLVPGGTYI